MITKQRLILGPALALILAGTLAGTISLTSQAAKKYYPPGFYPPDASATPVPATPAPAPAESAPAAPGAPSVIIKHVPVKPKPRDPLTVMLEEQRYYEALRLLDQRIAAAPKNLSLRILKAQVLRRENSFDQAVAEYNLVLDQTRTPSLRASAFNGLGWTYYAHALLTEQLGDQFAAKKLNEQAESYFKQALQFNPKLLHAWVGLAQWALSRGNLQQAEGALTEARKLDGNNTLVLMTQAELLLAKGKPEEAQPLIYKARQQAPKDPSVLLALGKTSLALGRDDDVIIQLKQLLEMTPDNPEALRLLSTAYENKMKPADAEQALQKALALNPADLETARALLKTYDQAGEADRGIVLLKQLVKQQPAQAAYQAELLSRLNKVGRFSEAYRQGADYVAASQALSESDAEVLGHFARAAYYEGKSMLDRNALLKTPAFEKALAYYQGQLKVHPDALEPRLRLLQLNPLVEVPTFQAPLESVRDQALGLQLAFLQGDTALHQQRLQLLSANPQATPAVLLETARQLLEMNDFEGARVLAEKVLPQADLKAPASAVQQSAITGQAAIEQHLVAVKKLSRNLPDQYWDQAMASALGAGSGHWRVHAGIADRLEGRKQYDLAYTQQLLAAHFAPNAKDRESWIKKAEKTKRRYQAT